MRIKLLREWLLVALLTPALLALLIGLGATARADALLYDMLARMRSPLPSRIQIIAIDEMSLAAIGRWPWPREVHARLLDRLAGAGAVAIGYDVLFVEPSPADRVLAGAAARAGRVVLPMTFSVPGQNGAAYALQLPTLPLRGVAAEGHAVLVPDGDGIVRGISLYAGDARHRWPSFAERIVRQATGRPSRYAAASSHQLPAGDFGLSTPLLVPLTGASHPTVPFVSLLNGEVPPELLRDGILLVGSTAAGSSDNYATAAGALPGVEVLADTVDALMGDRMVYPADRMSVWMATLVPLSLLLAGFMRLPPRANLLVGIALVPATILASAALLFWLNVWLSPALAIAGLLIVYPLWGWRRLAATSAWMTEELTRLQDEDDPLPGRTRPANDEPDWHGDRVGRQTALLERATSRMRELRRFFAESLHALPQATLITDEHGRVIIANQLARTVFGDTQDAVLAALFAAHFPGSDPTRIERDGGGELVTPDGRHFRLRIEPFAASGGRVVGAILCFSEMTEIRLAEKQREEALSLLSHDMRAPQVAILALLDRPQPDRARLEGYARRTIQLADGFVRLARAEAAPIVAEVLDLAVLLIEAADDLWPVAEAKSVRIVTPDETEEYLIEGDRELLSRMLVNVLGNAVRHSPAGGVIDCSLQRQDENIRCRIADEGSGIPAAMLERIFEPFNRGASPDQSGIGLGLAFVRSVAGRHGGQVIAENGPRGAVFTISLPAA